MVLARGASAWWLVLLAATGCRQIFGLSDPIDAGGPGGGDGKPKDGMTVDVPVFDGPNCYGEPGWQVCLSSPPSGPVSLPANVDSEGVTVCATTQPTSWSGAGQPHACFVIGTTITVSSSYATGNYPLVLVASDSITIGDLDISAHGTAGADPGAGGNPNGACSFGTTPQTDGSGGGGGAGATLATQGGDGGSGNAAAASGGTASPGGAPSRLRGGCRGQNGGDGGGLTHGSGGNGGGAVYLVAGNTITITGSINASGAGAGGAGVFGGGGGGGGGGMIVLDAPSIMASGAVLIANGGGGGAGGTSAASGGNGSTPSTQAATTAAAGGTGG
ncbi:MAG: hypothetical protein ACM31C_21860, partial [Acidobacteriota bacterium]